MVNDLEDRMMDISKAEQTKETRMKRKNEKKKETCGTTITILISEL